MIEYDRERKSEDLFAQECCNRMWKNKRNERNIRVKRM